MESLKTLAKDALDAIADRLGYEPKDRLARIMQQSKLQKSQYDRKVKEMENMRIAEIAHAIRTARMVKAKFKQGSFSEIAEAGEIVNRVDYDYEHPLDENWYVISTRIDVSVLQRMYSDLNLSTNSPEYRYVIDGLLYEIQKNIDVLMRVNQ